MLKDKLLETIREYSLIDKGELVLIGVSGGADSTALLHLLDSLKEEFEINLHVAHLNHLLRKGDAELDARYVQGLAQNLKVPVSIESFDVQAYAGETGKGIEEAAREARYDFFARTAKKVGAKKIAVGHTADDNVETFLMRLLRGSGIKGLCGIPPKRGTVIRPMIKIWRKEIEDYVGGLKLVPRRDHTNYESKFMRNRVRMKLIPQLKIYNLNIKEIILQTILLLTEDAEYLDRKTEEAINAAFLSAKEDELVLDLSRVLKLDLPVQGHLIRKAIERVKGNLTELTYAHVHTILENMNNKERWESHLPGGATVYIQRDKIGFARVRPRPQLKKEYRYLMTVPGEIEIAEIGKKLRVSVVENISLEEINQNGKIGFIDYNTLAKQLVVRNRNEGDRFVPLGMRGSKKVQDLFIDEKVPLEERDLVPMVESGGKIVWVGGMRIDERVKVTPATTRAVKFELL